MNIKAITAGALGLIVALGIPNTSATAESARFIQDRFAIGFWVDPPANKNMNQSYADIAAANFTIVIGGLGANTPEAVQRQIKLCKKYGLKAIVARAGLPLAQLPESPAVWGYLIHDEPHVSDFPALRKTVDSIRKVHPGKLSYINLYPDGASEAQLGTKTYDEHVRRFVEEVDADVLSMDHYPMMTPSVDGRDSYCRNLEVMRHYSMQKDIPFWNYFNVMPYGPHFDPTEAQLRWEIYTSIAYGAKGVMYFCYWTPLGDEYPKGGAIITAEGRKTRHYEQAQRINDGLKKLGPTLMKLTSTGIYRVKPEDDAGAILKDTPLLKLTKGDYLVGVFKHADGRRAVLINNYNFAYTAWPTIEFDVPVGQVREVSKATGKEIPVVDDSPAMDGLQISLDSGEGRLFLLPAK